ncbi:hypothetical protein [Arthrobacter burdickii]|uniref:Uncharacterized protein n=1 Tax=Arthrobacter burdickii TaxID=3035920 RepID=A0ABT8K0W5_9MICC|nr:hypothetical protein [Arthrobacter burdickii]MDN4611060.1 hypothetical protein [Arthrobacter burdickii]
MVTPGAGDAAGAGDALGAGAALGAVAGAGAVEGTVGAAVEEGTGAGTASLATAGTALPRRPKDSRAAHSSRAGEGKVTGFSSRIRASAS